MITTCQVVLLLACLACLLSLSFSIPAVWYDSETGESGESPVRCDYVEVRSKEVNSRNLSIMFSSPDLWRGAEMWRRRRGLAMCGSSMSGCWGVLRGRRPNRYTQHEIFWNIYEREKQDMIQKKLFIDKIQIIWFTFYTNIEDRYSGQSLPVLDDGVLPLPQLV